ncbi:hypothetical protein GH733_016769, partial [Mirounga leonina]
MSTCFSPEAGPGGVQGPTPTGAPPLGHRRRGSARWVCAPNRGTARRTSPSTPGIICADSTSDRSGERGRPRETGSGASAHGAAPAPPSAAPASPAAGAPPPAPAPPTPASRSRACAASGARVRASRAVCCGVCGFLLRARALKKVLIVVRSSGGEDGDPTSESAGRKETVSREVKADKRSKNPPPIAPRVRSAPGDGVSAPRTPFLIKNS